MPFWAFTLAVLVAAPAAGFLAGCWFVGPKRTRSTNRIVRVIERSAGGFNRTVRGR